MFGTKKGAPTSSRGRIIILAVALALVVILIASAVVFAIMNDTGEMTSREDIEAKLAELGTSDLGHTYVANHILDYGIGGFDSSRLRNVEFYFNTKYAGELPSVPEMAYEAATLFMEHYFDRIDFSDRASLTTAIIHCYVEATGDDYAVYRLPEEREEFTGDMSGTFVGIGVSVIQTQDPVTGLLTEVLVESVMDGSGALEGGILPGDLIVAVDGSPVYEHTSSELVSMIRGEIGTTVTVSVLRDGETLELVCERRNVVEKTVDWRIEDGIGHVRISSFKSNTDELFAEAISYMYTMGAKGIVFDLRSNPGGYLDAVLNVLDTIVGANTPLASYVDASGNEVVYNSTGSGAPLSIPSVVICNGYTASAGELFTAAMRDYSSMGILDAEIVGTTTYGKGIMQSTYPFFDGSSITLTSAFYNPPSGVNYHGVGITPDHTVEASDEGDAQMDRAIEVVKKMISDVGGTTI